jgi:hypothetical protein
MGAVRQVSQRARELDLQPVLNGVPADGFIPPALPGLAIGADEPPAGCPPLPPSGLVYACGAEMVTGAGQPTSAPADRYAAISQAGLNLGQAVLKDLQPTLLLPAFGTASIPAGRAGPFADRHCQAPPDAPDPCS